MSLLYEGTLSVALTRMLRFISFNLAKGARREGRRSEPAGRVISPVTVDCCNGVNAGADVAVAGFCNNPKEGGFHSLRLAEREVGIRLLEARRGNDD